MKIFGLGFHKTGSTTLETALITLGYSATGNLGKQELLYQALKEKEWKLIEDFLLPYDGFRDMPWPLFYKELDKHFPGSKFILTTRSEQNWLESCVNHYKEDGNPFFEKIYGEGNHFPVGNEEIWLHRYREHNREIKSYFKDRPNDFLELSWEDGDGWEKICTFLDKPIPDRDFPHANKGKYNLLQKIQRRIHYMIDKDGFKKKNRDL